MPRIAYVNGRYAPLRAAAVSVEDRGFQFADGVYEYFAVFDGRLADADGHLERLWRSLGELRIAPPMSQAALTAVLRETVRRNRVRQGSLYLQITRGAAPRDHPFPDPAPTPSVIVTAKPLDFAEAEAKAAVGVAVLTVPDNRWGRCDIKTVGLLPNVLARQAAIDKGARDAWFVDKDGNVTEAASANTWIVRADGTLVTRHADHAILRGITRTVTFDVVKAQGLSIEERAFTLEEAYAAREAFETSATQIVMPVVSIDGRPIGDGKPGPVATALRRAFHRFAEAD